MDQLPMQAGLAAGHVGLCDRRSSQGQSDTAVLKKDGVTQRKLIMACPASFLQADVKLRGSQGIGGSAAMRMLHSEDQDIEMAVLDESNAFSAVQTPRWVHF